MNKINNINSTKVLKVFALIAALTAFSSISNAVPSVASTNLQTTSGVSISQQGNALNFTAPDRSVLSWNNFGSGSDAINLGDTLSFNLPNSNASILNVVLGSNQTAINGTIESNAKVYILNPNGIVVGGGARIDTAQLTLSTVDNPFAAQFKYLTDGTIPSESGTRTASGTTTVQANAIIASPNITILTKDITIGAALTGGNMTVLADGSVAVGSAGLTTWISGNLSITNPTGSTTIGVPTGIVGSNGNITIDSVSGNIVNAVGSRVNGKNLTVKTTSGDVSLGAVAVTNVTASGKNVSVAFENNPSVNFSGTATSGSMTVSAPTFLNLAEVNGNSAGNFSFTAGSTLTLGKVHLDVTGNTSFTGSRVADSTNGVFVYGSTSFTATSGDVAITKANHSFGPLSASASGNVSIFENGAINMNVIRGTNVSLKTNEFAFQTPTTASILATKLSLDAAKDVIFYTGTISNGLAVNTLGNVDLGRLSLATNLNNVAPTVTTTGTVTNPSP
jgi:filamentous hemagglutinin family protein